MYMIAVIVFKPVVALWLGRELDYQPGLIGVMCLYYILFSIVALNTHIINGTGKINFQVILMSFLGVINTPLSVFFCKRNRLRSSRCKISNYNINRYCSSFFFY